MEILKRFLSTALLLSSVVIVCVGIYEGFNATQVGNPVTEFVLLAAFMILLAVNEGFQG